MPTVKFVEWKRGGASREVICIGRWAWKIQKLTRGWQQFLIGLLANMQERDLSKRGSPKLCPVVFALPGGWLVVMPRGERPLIDAQADAFYYIEFLSFDDGFGDTGRAERQQLRYAGRAHRRRR